MFILDFCSETKPIWGFVGQIVNILKIAIPIIIILLGTLDLGKAVLAGKEDDIKKAQGMLIKRLIYGVAIFFVATIVQFVFGLVGQDVSGGSGKQCFKCISKPSSCPASELVK